MNQTIPTVSELVHQDLDHNQQAWRRNKNLLRRVPANEQWPGGMSLAVMVGEDVFHKAIYHGDHILLNNEGLTWAALRYVPPGHFPRSPLMHERFVAYVSLAKAYIRHGMPLLDFSHLTTDAWDFNYMPYDKVRIENALGIERVVEAGEDILNTQRNEREFTVFNRMVSRLLDGAFSGTVDGEPLNPKWDKWAKNPGIAKPHEVGHPDDWMPRPYIAFPHDQREKVYTLATESQAKSFGFECGTCHRRSEIERFHKYNWDSESGEITDALMIENGDFFAPCPACGTKRKWHLSDALPCHVQRRFPHAFRRDFCRDVSLGLPLPISENATYVGIVVQLGVFVDPDDQPHGENGERLHLYKAEFERKDGSRFYVYLPEGAEILAKPGDHLLQGAIWAKALGDGDVAMTILDWSRRTLTERFNTLSEVCGGGPYVGFLQRLWFESNAIRPLNMPDIVLYPAAYAANAAYDVDVKGLWWDMSRCDDMLVSSVKAYVLPPIRLSAWDDLRFTLIDQVVDVNAEIGDVRFSHRYVAVAPREQPVNKKALTKKAKEALQRASKASKVGGLAPLPLPEAPPVRRGSKPVQKRGFVARMLSGLTGKH